jgi:hypothetical protein
VAANVAEPFLNGGLAGQAHAGRSFSVTPTATARSANVSSGSAQAKGQNSGLRAPVSSVAQRARPIPLAHPTRFGDFKLAASDEDEDDEDDLDEEIHGPVLRSIPESATDPIPLPRLPTAEEILRPRGRLIGQPGENPGIRLIRSFDPLSSAEDLFWDLTREGRIGTVVNDARYPGILVRLPNGGFVGVRPVSTSGPPTVDLNIPGIDIREIKFLSFFE